jgi:hypothetical protein
LSEHPAQEIASYTHWMLGVEEERLTVSSNSRYRAAAPVFPLGGEGTEECRGLPAVEARLCRRNCRAYAQTWVRETLSALGSGNPDSTQ